MSSIKNPVLHCFITSLLNGCIYGYATAIIGGISTACVNHFFRVYDVVETSSGDTPWECVRNNFTNPADVPSESALASWRGLFSADILLGNLIGAYLGPAFSKKYGRRKAMLLTSVIGCLASVGMAFANEFAFNAFLRTLQGVAIGFCATVGPSYVSEVAPPSRRGQLGTLFQVFICVSILLAQLTNYFFNPTNIENCMPSVYWQLQLSITSVLFVLLGVYAMALMPESPVYEAIAQNSSSSSLAAAGVLGTIDENSTDFVETQVQDTQSGWHALFSARGLKWILAAIGLPMCQQLTGINAIMFYGPTIISHMGFGSQALLVNFLAVGVWNLLSVFVSFVLIDRLGRRVLMLSALFVMSSCLLALGILFHSFDLGSSSLSYTSLVLIMVFILAFETGPGPLFWVIANEMFPAPVRSESIAIANIFQSGFNILLTLSFPILLLAMGDPHEVKNGVRLEGTGSTFFILGAISVLSFAFVYMRIPETQNMDQHSLEPKNVREEANFDIINERRHLLGKTLINKNLLETPAGVSWSPASAVGSSAK